MSKVSNRIKQFVNPCFASEDSKALKNYSRFTELQSIQNEVNYWKFIHSFVTVELSFLGMQRVAVLMQGEDSATVFLPLIFKRIRNRVGWSQTEMANRVSEFSGKQIDKTSISRLENQKRNPASIDLLEIFCRVFGVQLSSLFRYAEDLAIFEALPETSQAKIMKSVIEQMEVVEEEGEKVIRY